MYNILLSQYPNPFAFLNYCIIQFVYKIAILDCFTIILTLFISLISFFNINI